MSEIATLIDECGAIKQGKFKLSDGSLTDYYIDKYVFETQPDVLGAITDELAVTLVDHEFDVIAGPALGAVPLVTALSLKTGVGAAFIRTGEKHKGTQARIEGTIAKGDRVAVLEDVTTTGSTILETAHVVESVGGLAERLLAVVDRNEGAEERLRKEGYDLECLVRVGEDLDIQSFIER